MAVNLVDLAETIENLTAEEKKALNILIGNECDADNSIDTLTVKVISRLDILPVLV